MSWEARRSDDYWQGWHKGNEEAAKRVREYEVEPLKQMYSMISRTLDAAHAELTELRNRQRSPLYTAGELSVELMSNKAVAVKPTGMIFDVSDDLAKHGYFKAEDCPWYPTCGKADHSQQLNVNCDECWDGQIRYSDNATFEEWMICPKCGGSE